MKRPGKYFDSELIARLARLELTARRIVDGFLSGKNRSSRHGFSVEFVEHREYCPGDDLRHLDWKVLGRLDRYYIKRYEEETNITAVICLDTSASMLYGSGAMTKFEAGATAAAAIAYLLHRQRDAVGLALHDESLRVFHPPSVRITSLANLVARLDDTVPTGKSSIEEILKGVVAQLPRRCLFILVSDFFVSIEELESSLRFLQFHGHDAVILQVLDAAERTFPFRNNMLFRGLEDRRELLTEPHRLRERYLELLEAFLDSVRKTCSHCAFDYQLIDTTQPLAPALTELIATRARRQRIVQRARNT